MSWMSLAKEFLRGLEDVVCHIPDYPQVARIVLPGNTASAMEKRIQRYARRHRITLPPIIHLASRQFPDDYVVGRDSHGRIVRPKGLTLVIEDATDSGEKVRRMALANDDVRIMVVVTRLGNSFVDYVSRKHRDDLADWVLKKRTPNNKRWPDPPEIERFG